MINTANLGLNPASLEGTGLYLDTRPKFFKAIMYHWHAICGQLVLSCICVCQESCHFLDRLPEKYLIMLCLKKLIYMVTQISKMFLMNRKI